MSDETLTLADLVGEGTPPPNEPQGFTLAEVLAFEAELEAMSPLERGRRFGREVTAGAVATLADVLGGAARLPAAVARGTVGQMGAGGRAAAEIMAGAAGETGATAGRALAQEIAPEPSPAFESGYAGSFVEQEGARALGSGIGFLALGGALGAAAGLGAGATAGLIGGLGQAEAQYQDALRSGEDENSPAAWAAYLGGMGLGQLERFGLGRILGRINDRTGGLVRRLLGDMAREGAEEVAQEVAQTGLGNVLARHLYDEEREYLEGVAEAGKAGGFAGVVLSALGTGFSRSLPRSPDASAEVGGGREGPAPTTQEGAAAATQPAPAAESAQERPAAPEDRPVALIPERAIPAFLRFRDAQPAEARPRLRPVAPQTKAETWATEFARARGAEAVVVDAGAPLPLPAMYAEGTVFLDARADERAQLAQVAFHEMTHHLAAVQPGGFEEIVRALESVDPDGLAAAEADYRAEYAQRTGKALPADISREEGVARYVETVAKYVEGAFADPQRMVRLATEQPSLVRRILDWLVQAARRLGIKGLSTSLEKVQAEFGAAPGALTEAQAAAVALKIREGFNGLLGRAVPEGRQVKAPTVQRAKPKQAAQPAPAKRKAKPALPPVSEEGLAGLTPKQRRAEKKRRRRAQVREAREERAKKAGLEIGRRGAVRAEARKRGVAAREAALEQARADVREAGAEPLFALAAKPDARIVDRFAVAQPSDEQTRRTLREAEKALTVSGETAVGSSPSIIADPSDDIGVRAFNRGAREVRALEAGGLDVQHRADVYRKADEALKDRGAEFWKTRLLDKLDRGDAMNEVETVILGKLKTEAVLGALGQGELGPMKEAGKLAWAFEEVRRTAGRTLGINVDALKSAREQMADIIATPGKQRRERLNRLVEKRDGTENQAKKKRAQRLIDRELEKDAEQTLEARKALHDAGYRPDLVTQDYFDDPVSRARIGRIVQQKKSGTWDWLIEWRLASMLSLPTTHAANITGNAALLGYEQIAMRTVQALLNEVVQDPDSPTLSEVKGMMRAMMPGTRLAGHYLLMAYRTQTPVFEADMLRESGREEDARTRIDSLPAPAIPGRFGEAVRMPSLTTLLAFDEAAKALAATMEGQALAYRQAKAEGLSGEAASLRVMEILADLPPEIADQSLERARVLTLQDKDDSQILRKITDLRNALNVPMPWGWDPFPLGRILFPFVQTPYKLFRFGLVNAVSPAKVAVKAIVGGYKGDKPAMVEDSARALLALGMYLALASLLDDDRDLPWITGTREYGDPIPGMSVRIGDTYYNYARIDPIAVQVASIIDGINAWRLGQADPMLPIRSIMAQMSDKTFLRTFGDIYNAATESARYGTSGVRLAISSFFTSFIPNIIRGPARLADENVRARTVRKYDDAGVWEAGMRSLPYEAFPAPIEGHAPPIRYDVWGRPVRRSGTRVPYLLRLVNPMADRATVEEITHLDVLFAKRNEMIADGRLPDEEQWLPRPPQYWLTVNGKTRYMSDEQYAAYSKRVGEMTFEAMRGQTLTPETVYDAFKQASSRAREQAKRELRIRESFQP